MLGQKRANVSKDPPNQPTDNTNKKTSVSALTRTSSMKIKESQSPVKKCTNLSSTNTTVQSNLAKTPVSQKSPSRQLAKDVVTTNARAAPKSTPSLVKTATASSAKSFPNKGSLVNFGRERSQPLIRRDTNPDLTKSMSKTKAFRSKMENRQSTSSIHPVAFVREESKMFKDRSNMSKKPQTATFKVVPGKRITECTNADDERSSLGVCSSRTFNALDVKDEGNTVRDGDSLRTGSFVFDQPLETNANDVVESSRYDVEAEIRSGNAAIKTEVQETREGKQNVRCEQVCVCDKEVFPSPVDGERTDQFVSAKENNEAKSSDLKQGNASRTEKSEGCEASSDSHQRWSTGQTTHNTCAPRSGAANTLRPTNSPDKTNQFSNETQIKIQSKMHSKYDLFEKKSSVEANDLRNSKESIKEMKQSPSTSTLEGSFDADTVVLEKPFVITSFDQTVAIDKERFAIRKEPVTSLKTECLPSPRVKSDFKVDVLGNDPSVKKTGSDLPFKRTANDLSFKKTVSDLSFKKTGNHLSFKKTCNDFQEDLEKENVYDDLTGNNVHSDNETLSEAATENRDIFECVDTLEVLNLGSMCNVNNSVMDLSDNVLLTYLSDGSRQKRDVTVCESDEFASESEEVVETIDVSDCVWMDYKVPLNRPRREEIWMVDEETDSDGERRFGEDAVLMLEPEKRDWMVAERSLDELRACLDECELDVANTAREIVKITNSNYYRRPNSLRQSNSLKTFNRTKENVSDIQLLDISRPRNTLNEEMAKTNTTLRIEDDLDYFSVSSGDEVGDVKSSQTDLMPEKSFLSCEEPSDVGTSEMDLKPQDSLLSFGKSCAKKKKKNEKKVLLSFFNLFK